MESWIDWLPRVGALLTLIIGLVGFFKPRLFLSQVGIEATTPMAHSEARAVFGGIHLGLAIAAFALGDPAIFTAIGMGWTVILLARLWSMAADGTSLKDTIPALIVDGGLAVLFLAPVLFG